MLQSFFGGGSCGSVLLHMGLNTVSLEVMLRVTIVYAALSLGIAAATAAPRLML
jgi:hypothetical protein